MSQPLHVLNRQLIYSGFKQLIPVSLFVIAFGLAFGLAATEAGLSSGATLAMSTFVFAGASQFAVLETWAGPVSVLPIILTVFAINARHLLMGATLYPWLQHLPPLQRYSGMLFVSDANWAMAMQAFGNNKPGVGILFGGGFALWISWILGTWLGLYFGNSINNPEQFGLDMVLACFLLSMVLGGKKDNRMLIIWSVAAGTSLLAYEYLPTNSHVVVGALAGGLLGCIWIKKHDD